MRSKNSGMGILMSNIFKNICKSFSSTGDPPNQINGGSPLTGMTGVAAGHTHSVPVSVGNTLSGSTSTMTRYEFYIMSDDFPTVYPSEMSILETETEKTLDLATDVEGFEKLQIGQKVGNIHIVEGGNPKRYVYTLEDCVVSRLSFVPKRRGDWEVLDISHPYSEVSIRLSYKDRVKLEKAEKMLKVLLKGK